MARMSNDEIIEKTLTVTSSFGSGGLLNAEQQDTFTRLVRSYSTLVGKVRFIRMPQKSMDIDKIHVGEVITEQAQTEGTSSTTDTEEPKFNNVTLTSSKVRSRWTVSTETLQSNIEQDRLEQTILNLLTQRIATDLDLLAIQGDTSLSGTTPPNALLKTLDGWDKLTNSTGSQAGHIVDASHANVSRSIFAAARRQMPRQYRADPGLRWIMTDSLYEDWQDVLATRVTPLGDTNHVSRIGQVPGPLGIPALIVPQIPEAKTATSGASEATAGLQIGTRQGPFVFTSSAKVFRMKVDGAASYTTITFTEGTLDAVTAAGEINTAVSGQTTTVDGFGRLEIKSDTTGGSSSIEVAAGSSNDCIAIIGFTASTNTGTTGSGNLKTGTFMWLANPENFIFGTLDGTRVFTEFNKDADRLETVVYNQVAVAVENPDSIIRVNNLRLKDYI